MHICIIGTGASGWLACTAIKNLKFIKKITIIGSHKIPPIGVGESTTLNFRDFLLENNIDIKEFVSESDAAVKYGVVYDNWSKNNFINFFNSGKAFVRHNINIFEYGKLLANKDKNLHIHDLIGNKLWKFIQENQVSLDDEEHIHSWHFDAGKFIQFIKNKNISDAKVNYIDDVIIDCEFCSEGQINYVIGESGRRYTSDYFVNCCGDNELNEKVFKEKYISLSPYLLTNKAIVYPLKYGDKQKQFHPYTIAKTMKYGWRWITPTQSRIGTGYVFSNNHVSVDEATNEFLEDIGDKTLEPILVDFNPKCNLKPFKVNNCTIGMSSGFLEPLDAPGLSISIKAIDMLCELLELKSQYNIFKFFKFLKECNLNIISSYKWWNSFILHQYKTSNRKDTQFWIDHKNVKCDFYDIINYNNFPPHIYGYPETMMFNLTSSGKNIQWNSNTLEKPFFIEEKNTKTIHHLEYIKKFLE